MENYISEQIKSHLINIGYSPYIADSCAQQGGVYYTKAVCNSKDPLKECCDHAGKLAQQKQPEVKYKSPKSQYRKRTKKPQEAFNFGDI